MKPSLDRWIWRVAYNEAWRVSSFMDADDLHQDGLMIYHYVQQRYPEVTNEGHLASLFQRSFINHIHKLSNKRTKELSPQKIRPEIIQSESESFCDWAELLKCVIEAPTDVSKVLMGLLATDDQSLKKPNRRYRNGTRETTNQRLCRVAGFDPENCNIHRLILDHLH